MSAATGGVGVAGRGDGAAVEGAALVAGTVDRAEAATAGVAPPPSYPVPLGAVLLTACGVSDGEGP